MSVSDFSQIMSNNAILFYILAFFLGSCFASFFNVYSLRYTKILEAQNANDVKSWFSELNITVPQEIENLSQGKFNLSFPASHCYSCKTPLKWYHNIPIISYLFLLGKCGFCKTKISMQYPLVESIGGVILAVVFHQFFIKTGDLPTFLIAALFFMTTYLLLIIDWKTMFLPDELNYFLIWFGLLMINFKVQFLPITLENAIYGIVASFMFFWGLGFLGKKLKGMEVIGGGDLKLVAAISPFIGLEGIIFTIFFSPIFGILFWIYSRAGKNTEIPYGPSLILSSWIYIFYGKEIIKMIV